MRGLASRNAAVARVCLAALTLGLSIPAGCSRSQSQADDRVPPGVVIVVLDTLRADHLSCYGYARQTTPNIDRFADGATLYADCISTAPWTLPAHASMFTGKYPFEHGAYPAETAKPGRANAHPLPAEELTLAEFLKAAGFETGGFVANAANCGEWTGIDQGFDTYYVEHVYAKRLLPSALSWLENRAGGPFFLFLNFMDTHRPYNVSPRPGFIDPPADPDARGIPRRFTRAVLPGTRPVPQELRRKLIDQYDTAIANVDEQVGRLLDKLSALDSFDRSLIVITSDHGEYFGEHLLTGHSKDVYQPALWVPLIVKAPGQNRGRVVKERMSLVALPNLICTQLPAAIAARAREQFPEAVGAPSLIAEKYPSARDSLDRKPWGSRFKRLRRALFSGPYKYIHSSDQQHELYNLEQDPGEKRNLINGSGELAAQMAALLDGFLAERQKATRSSSEGAPLSEKELRMLARLGYIDAPGEEEGSPDDEPNGDN